MSDMERPADFVSWRGSDERVLAEVYDVALLDLDGVVYVGPRAVPGVPDALRRAGKLGMRSAFVTNNAARPPRVVCDHLRKLGLDASEHQVINSAMAAARVVAEMVPRQSRVLVVGDEGLVLALWERDLVAVTSMDEEPVAVVQGFSPKMNWAMLCEGAYAIAAGLPWVASNLDATIPTARGRAPGNGTFVEVLRIATGKEPVVTGKPSPYMHRESMLRTNAQRPLVVGDRLDTDIEGAARAGADSLLVFSGVTDPADLLFAAPEHRPSFIAEDASGLLVAHGAPTFDAAGGTWVDGSWAARRTAGGELVLDSTGDVTNDRLGAVRAACAAVWSQPDAFDPAQARVALLGAIERIG